MQQRARSTPPQHPPRSPSSSSLVKEQQSFPQGGEPTSTGASGGGSAPSAAGEQRPRQASIGSDGASIGTATENATKVSRCCAVVSAPLPPPCLPQPSTNHAEKSEAHNPNLMTVLSLVFTPNALLEGISRVGGRSTCSVHSFECNFTAVCEVQFVFYLERGSGREQRAGVGAASVTSHNRAPSLLAAVSSY
jgi:hypothetical protein